MIQYFPSIYIQEYKVSSLKNETSVVSRPVKYLPHFPLFLISLVYFLAASFQYKTQRCVSVGTKIFKLMPRNQNKINQQIPADTIRINLKNIRQLLISISRFHLIYSKLSFGPKLGLSVIMPRITVVDKERLIPLNLATEPHIN